MANKLYQSKAWLLMQYQTKGRSIEDIAKQCGVHPLTIRRQLNAFDIRIAKR